MKVVSLDLALGLMEIIKNEAELSASFAEIDFKNKKDFLSEHDLNRARAIVRSINRKIEIIQDQSFQVGYPITLEIMNQEKAPA